MQKQTDTFKEFPVSAPGSNYLGHRLCGSERRNGVCRWIYI